MFVIGNELLKLVLIDSLILLIAIIISSIYISKKSIGKEKIALYIYMIVTFSIYNIYVKPVQDYLLPIPRTYIFYQKIVAGLSIYDFFSIDVYNRQEHNYPDSLIVRLPGIYGINLKKNFLFDMIHIIPTMLKEDKYEELSKKSKLIASSYRCV